MEKDYNIKHYTKANSELVAVCMFCAITNTATLENYDRYYERKRARYK